MAARIDLAGILASLKTIFDAANTTTASPIYLSQDMATKVNTVLTLNPDKLPPQASMFPLVTCYVTKKTTKDKTIGRSQANIKRETVVEIDVVGAVWNDTFNTATDDPADKDIHYLMENIELILRSNETLLGKATWQAPTEVNYYTVPVSEDAHLRSGIMALRATIYN